MNFIVISSSRGTTFQSVIESLMAGTLTAKCLGLVTDNPERQCIGKAQAAGLPYKIALKVKGGDRELLDKKVDAAMRELIKEAGADPAQTLLAEMGWMWIHTSWFIKRWRGRILNVHPALLPKYGGKGMYGDHVHEAVLNAKEPKSGVTIHIMDEGVDTGPILLQKTCAVEPDDTVDALKAKVQGLEKEWYPKVLQMIEDGTLELPA